MTSYGPTPGLEVVRLDDERFLLRSDFVALELAGEAGAAVVEHVLGAPRPLTLDQIARLLPEYRRESLEQELLRLVSEHVLVTGTGDGAAGRPNAPFVALLDALGLDTAGALQRLAEASVGIMGLEAHGAHVAQQLADAGVGRLVLADPYAFEREHQRLTPVGDDGALGLPRELAVARRLERDGLVIDTTGSTDAFDREAAFAVAARSQLVVVCWDRGFSAAQHWANEAAIHHDVPALFSELRALKSFAGPLLLPGRSACWMCYRMRSLACEEDFDRAMSYEEHLDRAKAPRLAERPVLPGLAPQLASLLALEVVKYLIRFDQPKLVDKVIEFDGLASEQRMHPVLVEPGCPACAKKAPRRHPRAGELIEGPGEPAGRPLHELTDTLVSDRTGIVTDFGPVGRDATEPALPLVWRAKLANHRFASEPEDSHRVVSGKGFTREAAWASCLGEAVERYSGGRWDESETVFCRRDELDGRSVDPAELVLLREEELSALPYSGYGLDTTLRWVRGRSLVHGDDVWVPAISVFMEYEVAAQEEYLCAVTSNGLAAGPTLRDAVLRAIGEVLERDAFLIAWMNRLPARRLDPSSHVDVDVRRLAESYRRRGVELVLYWVPADHPMNVVAAIAYQRGGFGGPFATVGLGADVDLVAAARGAALEVGQVRPAFRARARLQDVRRIRELEEDPSRTETLEDHALLYANHSMAGVFAFLDGERVDWPPAGAVGADDALATLLDHFREVGQEVVYVNLTSPDLEPLGLHAVRAILPGFQPISFGIGERRLGGRRLYELPWRLGLRDAPSDVDSLNPLPHPIA